MLKALGRTSPFQSNTSQEVEQAEEAEENVQITGQPQAFDYTFEVNKKGQNQSNEHYSNIQEKQRVLDFNDPYMYNNTPVHQNEKQGIQTILVQLDNYLRKNQNMGSSKSLPYSERQSEMNKKQNHHNYSASVRAPQIQDDHEVWQKSYQLLERLNSERYSQVAKIKPEKISIDDNLKGAISEASSYRKRENFHKRSVNRHSSQNIASKSRPIKYDDQDPKRTRNNTVRSITEVKTTSSRPDFILFNKNMINEMLKMLNPSPSKCDRF
jgi:hypothetical protein